MGKGDTFLFSFIVQDACDDYYVNTVHLFKTNHSYLYSISCLVHIKSYIFSMHTLEDQATDTGTYIAICPGKFKIQQLKCL
jgi:hypothetical protein